MARVDGQEVVYPQSEFLGQIEKSEMTGGRHSAVTSDSARYIRKLLKLERVRGRAECISLYISRLRIDLQIDSHILT
jgi:hypothetical protein